MIRELRDARVAEIQAISIYEAEVFWVRSPNRRALLVAVLAEERSHERGLREYSAVSRMGALVARIPGWVIGSLLAALPWKVMCRVQAWAETEAAAIYTKAMVEYGRTRLPLDPRVMAELERARDQELEHASLFRDPRTGATR